MTKVAVLGAGAGGSAAAVELSKKGFGVTLWNRSARTLEPHISLGGVEHEGVLGEGFTPLASITTNLAQAIDGVDAILVCLPTFIHEEIARTLAELRVGEIPVVLNPGHTGGALAFRHAYLQVNSTLPPLAEFSTLTYVARKPTPTRVNVTGRARSVRLGALPGGEAALALAQAMFDSADPVSDVLAADLSNANLVLHPPGAVLAAAWVEARSGDFRFYVDGMTPGVARVMTRLDEERRLVARALGHELPPLVDEMKRIGTVDDVRADPADLVSAIGGGAANARIKAPDSLQHRYYLEDFGHGLVPFIAIAQIAGVATPTANALLELGETLTGVAFRETGRTAASMGIADLDRNGLIALARGDQHD